MRKILISILVFFGGLSVLKASSPFDIIYNSYPDFVVSDVWLDNKDFYMKICNIGANMNELGTLTIGAKINSSVTVSNVIQNVNLDANSCGNYCLAPVKDYLNTTSNGSFNISAGVIMQESKTEKTKSNNSLKKVINISNINNYKNNINYINNTSNIYNNTINIDPAHYPYASYPQNISLLMPDLIVDNIWQDHSNALNARICNIGYSMNTFQSSYVVIYNGNFNAIKNLNLKLNQKDCVNVTLGLGELGIYSNGNYNIKASANAYKNISESNENNNSLSKNLYLRIY